MRRSKPHPNASAPAGRCTRNLPTGRSGKPSMHCLQRSTLKTARAWRDLPGRCAPSTQALQRLTSPSAAQALGSVGPVGADGNSSSASAEEAPSIFLASSTASTLANTIVSRRQIERFRGLAQATGYHRVENFIAMAYYLIAEKLTHFPVSPFARFLPVLHETT
jgi:hypothetical protein